MIVECQLRTVVTSMRSLKSDIVYEVGYANLTSVQYVLVMGEVARVVFGQADYVEMDLTEWKRISHVL